MGSGAEGIVRQWLKITQRREANKYFHFSYTGLRYIVVKKKSTLGTLTFPLKCHVIYYVSACIFQNMPEVRVK